MHIHHVGLPHGGESIVRSSLASLSDRAHKLPSLATISASIDINLGLAKIRRDTVAGANNSTLRELANGTRQLVQVRLVSQAPAVDLVLDLSNLSPTDTSISGLENGKVDQRWLRGVVFPGGQKGAI